MTSRGFWRGKNAWNVWNVYLGNLIRKGVNDVTRAGSWRGKNVWNVWNVYLGNLIPRGVNDVTRFVYLACLLRLSLFTLMTSS